MAEQQAPGLWLTDPQRQDLRVPGREVVQSRVDIGPEAPLAGHTHPGEEIISILERPLGYQIESQPPKTFGVGEAGTAPAGAVHALRNAAAATRRNSPPMSWTKASRSSRWPVSASPPVRLGHRAAQVVVGQSRKVESYVQRN
jgi:quercetin dioxygenase-like cupin family protein